MPSKLTGNEILDHLKWRYATKAFDPAKRISDEDWRTLEDSLQLAPSSYGLQPSHFIVVNSEETRRRLAEHAPFNEAKFQTASHILILTRLRKISSEYIERYLTNTSDTRNIPPEMLAPFRDVLNSRFGEMSDESHLQWTARQTYIALGTFLTAAALLDIDTCAMEGIQPDKFDEVLGLTGGDYATVAAVAAGYRSAEDQTQFAPKVRLGRDELFATA